MHNENVRSLEKSNNVPEGKRKMVKQKIFKKDQHVHNSCYDLRSRAIKNHEKANNSLSYPYAATNKI